MLQFNTLKFIEIQLAKDIMFNKDSSFSPFYSQTKKSITYFAFFKAVYTAVKNNKKVGILIIDSSAMEICFYPNYEEAKDISLLEFIDSLDERFELSGYSFNFVCNDLSCLKGSEDRYDLISTVKFMTCNIEELIKSVKSKDLEDENLSVRNYKVKKDEKVRLKLQNDIFNSVEGRIDLTLKDIIMEEYSPKFIEDLCFILEEKESTVGYGTNVDSVSGQAIEEKVNPIGYGQVIKVNDIYFLVNFGITPEARGKGYGKKFLKYILLKVYQKGIKSMDLTVDNKNIPAVNLYTSVGFKEIKNTIKIKL